MNKHDASLQIPVEDLPEVWTGGRIPDMSSGETQSDDALFVLKDRYLGQQFIARGGMARVYRGLDLQSHRIVSIFHLLAAWFRDQSQGAIERVSISVENVAPVGGSDMDVLRFVVVGEDIGRFVLSSGRVALRNRRQQSLPQVTGIEEVVAELDGI